MEEYTQDRIDAMTVNDLEEGVYSIFDLQDPIKRAALAMRMSVRAKQLGVQAEFKKMLRLANEANERIAAEYTNLHASDTGGVSLLYGSNGKPSETIENYIEIMRKDDYFRTFRFNKLNMSPEITEDLQTRQWQDADDSAALRCIESTYGLCNEPKFQHALRLLSRERQYHPVRDYIDALKWDGTPRIEEFLVKWLNCADTPYSREVSRLIFAGGIHRIYEPGCKFDSVPVLIGTRQGEGKSSLVKWLAIKDEWYSELTSFEGQEGIEAIQGVWICEIGELLALVKAKEVESIKAYITRQTDKYRVPYDRRSSSFKRQCIFIGTTNKERFLTDKTGNRRFLPIRVNLSGYDLFAAEKECRAYIVQCWAEARAKFNDPLTRLAPERSLLVDIMQKQQNSEEDDWREGMIAAYLLDKDDGYNVCTLELWQEALGMGSLSRPMPSESNAIGLIMQRMPNWKRAEKPTRFLKYGMQRYWTKESAEEELPF